MIECEGDVDFDDEEAIVALMLLLKEKADRERLQAAMMQSQTKTTPDLKKARRTINRIKHSQADSATDAGRAPCSVRSSATLRRAKCESKCLSVYSQRVRIRDARPLPHRDISPRTQTALQRHAEERLAPDAS